MENAYTQQTRQMFFGIICRSSWPCLPAKCQGQRGPNLARANINFGAIKHYATPRRLAIVVNDVEVNQKEQLIRRRGPAIKAAFDKDGNALYFRTSVFVSTHDYNHLDFIKV